MNMPPVFGIAGWKKSGKTQLVVALIAEFSRRGLKVATVKHAHHSFDIDHEGTDSWKHRKAGASQVALVSSKRMALMRELGDDDEPSFDEILTQLSPCDLVLVEGFKRETHFKLETLKSGAGEASLWRKDDKIIALVGDAPQTKLPCFDRDDISGIADFIALFLKLEPKNDGK